MAATIADVRLVYPNGASLSDAEIQFHLTSAEEMASQFLTGASYSTILSDRITAYLAAHFLAISYENGGIIRQRVGDAEDRYKEGDGDAIGLHQTIYGKNALALDYERHLAILAQTSVAAEFRVLS